ncbi:hypothetical protein SOPP22_04970 [Shewanella sp. OPT22]|nr:hypothetical protein SOPP22_04970 [Shewanella sp. OPT22]
MATFSADLPAHDVNSFRGNDEQPKLDDKPTINASGETFSTATVESSKGTPDAVFFEGKQNSGKKARSRANQMKLTLSFSKSTSLNGACQKESAPANSSTTQKVTPSTPSAQKTRVFPEAFLSSLKPYRINDENSDYVSGFKFCMTGNDDHILASRATLVKTIKGAHEAEERPLFDANSITVKQEEGESTSVCAVAMSYPHSHDINGQYHFWDMIAEKKIQFIYDLTSAEKPSQFQYYKNTDEKGKLSVRASELDNSRQSLTVKVDEKTEFRVNRFHYKNWPDGGAVSVSEFRGLVNEMQGHIDDGILVHCLEGRGRTMCCLAGIKLKEGIENGTIDKTNYQETVAKIINQVRAERGTQVLTSEGQKWLLLDAAEAWLNEIAK